MPRKPLRLVAAVVVTTLLTTLITAVVSVLAVLVGPPAPATAATGLEGYRPGNLVSDAVFYNAAAMDEAAVRSFLTSQGAACVDNPDGTRCLKSYRSTVPTIAATPYCAALTGGTLDAAALIARVGKACGINPQMLLILLQKESGLVLSRQPNATMYAKATGVGCPDDAPCDPTLASFPLQVYGAAERFRTYRAHPTAYRYRADGTAQQVQYHPDTTCGSASFVIENQATAGLYIYTPYTPNAAALDAVVGTGDGCSTYGNRNFYRYLKLWFPAAQPRTGAPVYPSPPSATSPRPSGALAYAAHVQNIGWTAAVVDGAVAGTTGRALRVEALRLSTAGLPTTGTIEWRGHVQNVGWQPWTTTATPIGTTGRNLRLEAFEMRLTGDLATRYRLSYRAHVQDIGWQPARTDGQTAGTTGRGLRIEAVTIQLVPLS